MRANGGGASFLSKLPGTFAELLSVADAKLGGGFGAKRIFTEKAAEILEEDFELIDNDDVLYVSRGEDWIAPPSPAVVASPADSPAEMPPFAGIFERAAGGSMPSSAPTKEAKEAKPASQEAKGGKDLPPGWKSVKHEAKSGSYMVYEGPGGKKLRSIKEAWREHEGLPPQKKKKNEAAPPNGTASTSSSSQPHPAAATAAAAEPCSAAKPAAAAAAAPPKVKQTTINPAAFFAMSAAAAKQAAKTPDAPAPSAEPADAGAASMAVDAESAAEGAAASAGADGRRAAATAANEAMDAVDSEEEEEDEEVFDVAGIVGQREGKASAENPSGSEYLVVWRGYVEADNTWEPASNIFDSTVVEEYEQREAHLRTLAPAELREHVAVAAATLPSGSLPEAAALPAEEDAAGWSALARRADQLLVQQHALAEGSSKGSPSKPAGGGQKRSAATAGAAANADGAGGVPPAKKARRALSAASAAAKAEKAAAKEAEKAAKEAAKETERLQKMLEREELAKAKAEEKRKKEEEREKERLAKEEERLQKEAEKAVRAAEKAERLAEKEAERVAKEAVKAEEVRLKEVEKRQAELRKAEQLKKLQDAKKRQVYTPPAIPSSHHPSRVAPGAPSCHPQLTDPRPCIFGPSVRAVDLQLPAHR